MSHINSNGHYLNLLTKYNGSQFLTWKEWRREEVSDLPHTLGQTFGVAGAQITSDQRRPASSVSIIPVTSQIWRAFTPTAWQQSVFGYQHLREVGRVCYSCFCLNEIHILQISTRLARDDLEFPNSYFKSKQNKKSWRIEIFRKVQS